MSLINLDRIEIKQAADIVGTDPSNPTPPGAAGRVAFSRDTNVLYFAEDDATWIQFLPQSATAPASQGGGGLVPALGGVGASATGTGFLNGYYSVDGDRGEIGIYYSGTAASPLTPSVFVYDSVEKYESKFLENVMAPLERFSLFSESIDYPLFNWDMERWAVAKDQEQTITIDSVTAGDLIGILINGAQASVNTQGADDSAIAAQVSILFAASYAGTWTSNGNVVTVSAPIGEIILSQDPLYPSGSDGNGTATIAETIKGHAAWEVRDNHGSLKPFKKIKDGFGTEYVACFGIRPHSNYQLYEHVRPSSYDLDTGESLLYDPVVSGILSHSSQGFTNWGPHGYPAKTLHDDFGQTGHSLRLHKVKVSRQGDTYYLTGLQSLWTGIKEWGATSPTPGADYNRGAITEMQHGGLHGSLHPYPSHFEESVGALQGRLRFPKISNIYYTNEENDASKGIDVSDGEVFYSHWVGNLPQPHRIHGSMGKGFLGPYISDFNNMAVVASATNTTAGFGANYTLKFGRMGVWTSNTHRKTINQKHLDSHRLHPGGAFYSSKVTGYNSIYEYKGHKNDAAWGNMVDDPFSDQWDDSSYPDAYTGTHSGIGRRHTYCDIRNTGGRDQAGWENHGLFGSAVQPVPEDLSDNGYTLGFTHPLVTGNLPYVVGTTAANKVLRDFQYEGAQGGNYRADDPTSSGQDWGNPNNPYLYSIAVSQHKMRYSFGHPTARSFSYGEPSISHSDGGDNYVNKSSQWPYNMMTCRAGGFSSRWNETVEAIKSQRLSWGPTDDFTFEVIHKHTPTKGGGSYNSFAKSTYSHALGEYVDSVNQYSLPIETESTMSMANVMANNLNLAENYLESQGVFLGLGATHANRWLTVGIVAGRFAVVNYRPFRCKRAGEYPQYMNWLAGQTLLESNKWYHFAVVKNSAENKLELYVNGVLDARATLVADVSAHGAAYNGGTYYTDTSVAPPIENLPVDNKYVPQHVSAPELGYGNYSWMGEYWGWPVKGSDAYTPDGAGGIGTNAAVPYSYGYLNVDKVAASNYRASSIALGGVPEEEGRHAQVVYHGEVRRSNDSTGWGQKSVEDIGDWKNRAGLNPQYTAITVGYGWPTYGNYGKFGPIHLANSVLYDGDFSNNFTVDPDYGVINSVSLPSKVSSTELLVDWSNAPVDSFDYEDMAYFDFKVHKGSEGEHPAPSLVVDVYGRIGDYEFNLSLPASWLTGPNLTNWTTNGWNPRQGVNVNFEGMNCPLNLYSHLAYFNKEGESGQNNIDSVLVGVRSSLITKYFNL